MKKIQRKTKREEISKHFFFCFNDHISGTPIRDYLEDKLGAFSTNGKCSESGKHARVRKKKRRMYILLFTFTTIKNLLKTTHITHTPSNSAFFTGG